MKLLYAEEHLSCYDYNNQNEPIIEYLKKEQEDTKTFRLNCNKIVFCIKGKCKYNFKYLKSGVLNAGFFVLFPRNKDCVIKMEEDSEFLVLGMHHKINFCNHFPLELLSEINKRTKKSFEESSLYLLEYNEMIATWLEVVTQSINSGLKCSHYQNLKQQEILFYLRAYYTKEDLYSFFEPIVNNDIQFSRVIYENYEKVESLQELAEMTNYSLSGFKKKFLKVFRTTPSIWIKREKAKKIYQEINCSQKSFKEIANEYNFSSPGQFNKFCQKMYKQAPGVLRENTRERVLLG